MNLLIHESNKAEEFSLKDGTIPDPISTYDVEFKIVQIIIKRQIEGGDTDKCNKIFNTCMGFSEETFTGFHHLYIMDKTSNNHQK